MKGNGGGTPSAAVMEAAADYRWLLDRKYPDQPTIKLVGDRYQLTGVERAMLFRGVFSESDSRRRASLLVGEHELSTDRGAEDSVLLVDGHNVLFTIWNYLAGRPMVAGTDGFIRDIGGTHSRLPHDERFTRLARCLCAALRPVHRSRITVLLDAPLPWSREHAAEIARIWNELDDEPPGGGAPTATVGDRGVTAAVSGAKSLEVRVEEHVDARVAAAVSGWIATSDTGIIDRCSVPVVDLGGYIVRRIFGAEPVVMTPANTGAPVTPGDGHRR